MFCPNCGQERISTETSFCSRCGFLLTGTAELIQSGGIIEQIPQSAPKVMTPRQKGIKQGIFIFLLTFLVVPIVSIFIMAINVEPYVPAICAVTLLVGGLLRMAYAIMFESNEVESRSGGHDVNQLINRQRTAAALPPQHSVPIPTDVPFRAATGTWRDTRDLQPPSVTDGTTKLLEQEEMHKPTR